MQNSGTLVISEELIVEFNKIKMKAAHPYMILSIKNENHETKVHTDSSQLHIEKLGEKGETYADMLTHIPKDDPRFIIFDYTATTDDGRTGNRLVFINWIPLAAPVSKKVSYSSNSKTVKNKLEHQAELSPDCWQEVT